MQKRESTGFGAFVIVLAIFAAIGFGYVSNIVKLANSTDGEKPYKAEILRTAGILIPPVGVVEGYLKINDK